MPHKDPDKRREYQRENMRKLRAGPNAAKYRESRAASMRRNPQQRRRAEQNRRARKLDQFVESVDAQILYEMHGGMCGICKEFIGGEFHVDHIIPLSKGGLHGYVNTQPAHPSCNLRKGNRV